MKVMECVFPSRVALEGDHEFRMVRDGICRAGFAVVEESGDIARFPCEVAFEYDFKIMMATVRRVG